MQRYYIAYRAEPGRPGSTPEDVFRLLGYHPNDHPTEWRLVTYIAQHSANLMIVGRPSDLGQTPLEIALVVRLCAAYHLSVHIVRPTTHLLAEPPEQPARVYHTTADFAELAAALLRSSAGLGE